MSFKESVIVELSAYDRGLLERIVNLLEPKSVDASFADVHQLVEGSPKTYADIAAKGDGKDFHGQPNWSGIYDSPDNEEAP